MAELKMKLDWKIAGSLSVAVSPCGRFSFYCCDDEYSCRGRNGWVVVARSGGHAAAEAWYTEWLLKNEPKPVWHDSNSGLASVSDVWNGVTMLVDYDGSFFRAWARKGIDSYAYDLSTLAEAKAAIEEKVLERVRKGGA